MRINLMESSSTFALTEVNATTVGALRQERDLGDSVINVDRVVAADDHVLEEREDGQEMNVAVVNKDKKGRKPATIRKRRQGSKKSVDLTLHKHILLDAEAGMPVAKAAKECGAARIKPKTSIPRDDPLVIRHDTLVRERRHCRDSLIRAMFGKHILLSRRAIRKKQIEVDVIEAAKYGKAPPKRTTTPKINALYDILNQTLLDTATTR